jgi:hypothetical protein
MVVLTSRWPCTDIVTGLEEVSGEGVAERVAGRELGDAGPQRCLSDGSLDDGFMQVVAPALARNPIDVGA